MFVIKYNSEVLKKYEKECIKVLEICNLLNYSNYLKKVSHLPSVRCLLRFLFAISCLNERLSGLLLLFFASLFGIFTALEKISLTILIFSYLLVPSDVAEFYLRCLQSPPEECERLADKVGL